MARFASSRQVWIYGVMCVTLWAMMLPYVCSSVHVYMYLWIASTFAMLETSEEVN